jgi:hypothetical protein
MQRAFDSDHVPKNFLLEIQFPSRYPRGLITKDEPVSFSPNAPGSDHKDLHKERMGESMLSQVNPLVGIARITPRNPQRKPSTSSCGTLKEEMLIVLFDLLMAKSTIISFLQEFLSSSQDVSRVKPII